MSGRFYSAMLLPAVAIAFAVAIFVVDTFTPLGIAVAALYAVVVLMAGRFLHRRGVLVVAGVCIGLTILSYAIQHGGSYGPALVRALVSLVAITVTTFLALKTQTADLKLREQAGLLEITHDAVIVRDMNDVITYWTAALKSSTAAHGRTPLGNWPTTSSGHLFQCRSARSRRLSWQPAAGRENSRRSVVMTERKSLLRAAGPPFGMSATAQ